MTHPPTPIPLTDTPIFGSLLTDSRFGDLARELLSDSSSTKSPIHATSALTDPLSCPACSPASLAFSMHNPTPPRDRGLALLPGSTTAASRLQPARRTRAKKVAS